jgi:TP53 regulating kinase-like protein
MNLNENELNYFKTKKKMPRRFVFTDFDRNQLKNLTVMKQGAEAKIYTGLTGEGENKQEVAIVKERFTKTYRHPDLDKSLTSKRIKNEVKLLQKAESLNVHVPKVFRADLNNGIIVMEYIQNSQTCREFILDLVKSDTDYNQVLIDLSVKIGRIIGNLHLNEIIHGDLTTSNILIVKQDNDLKIYFIDFGLSTVSKQLEDKAVDLYVLER